MNTLVVETTFVFIVNKNKLLHSKRLFINSIPKFNKLFVPFTKYLSIQILTIFLVESFVRKRCQLTIFYCSNFVTLISYYKN